MEKQRTDLKLAAVTALLGTAVGSVLTVLYPGLKIWDFPAFRQGFGIEPMSFVCLLGFSCLSICAAAVSGLSACGIPGVHLAVFSKSAALGAVLAGYYHADGFAGLLTSLLFVLPFGLCSLLVLLHAAQEACCGARWLTKAVLHAPAGDFPLKHYAICFWILALIQLGLTALQYGLLCCYPAFLSFMIH
ncbi:MAG: hypothetical protein IKN55_11930 [Oscillospiraceae bacterium]|nr:hypothetical protein [Oscillospiraceae bacterium]